MAFIFFNSFIKNVKNEKIHMDSEKSVSLFEIEKIYLVIYWAIIL